MKDPVELYHPALDRHITVPAAGVPQRERSGWRRCDQPDPDPTPVFGDAPVADADPEESE